jgi:hypothetical protein
VGCPLLVVVGARADVGGAGGFRQHVIHHGHRLVGQDLVGGRGGVHWVIPPQLKNRVDIDILVLEAQGVSWVEHLHPLDPSHEDGVVDPGVDCSPHPVYWSGVRHWGSIWLEDNGASAP